VKTEKDKRNQESKGRYPKTGAREEGAYLNTFDRGYGTWATILRRTVNSAYGDIYLSPFSLWEKDRMSGILQLFSPSP
jgi:hypothetical protein